MTLPASLYRTAFVVFVVWMVVGCQTSGRGAEMSTPEVPSTGTGLPIGPLVASTNSNAVVTGWQYLSPRAEEAWQGFPISVNDPGPDVIRFGEHPEDAYLRWREDGFDLVWYDVICSTQPVVVIEGTTISLWPNRHIWEDCEAAGVTHAFRVELETTIPQEAWHYEIHDGVPPVTLQTQHAAGVTSDGAHGGHRVRERIPDLR